MDYCLTWLRFLLQASLLAHGHFNTEFRVPLASDSCRPQEVTFREKLSV